MLCLSRVGSSPAYTYMSTTPRSGIRFSASARYVTHVTRYFDFETNSAKESSLGDPCCPQKLSLQQASLPRLQQQLQRIESTLTPGPSQHQHPASGTAGRTHERVRDRTSSRRLGKQREFRHHGTSCLDYTTTIIIIDDHHHLRSMDTLWP